jgi:uncharacterized protein YndB with AHSA1/START domain
VAAKHVYEIYVRTTPEALWQALTDPDRTAQYFFGRRVESTWQPGAPVRYVFEGDAATHGEVVEAEPPRRLVMTWSHTFADGVTEGPSRVSWEIEPLGTTCRLRLVHDDFHGVTRLFEAVGRGWPGVLSGMKTLLETGEELDLAQEPTAPAAATDIDALEHGEWGRRANQRVWALLGDGTPTEPAAVREVVEAAHASQWHWSYAGGALEAQRGEWLLSHVYARIGDAPAALRHARRCLEITEAEGYDDFDRAYAFEAMARAYAVSGDAVAEDEWRERAVEAGNQIADDEDRKIFEGDLNG